MLHVMDNPKPKTLSVILQKLPIVSLFVVEIILSKSTEYPNQHQMCRVNGIEAVFGRFASYEATGAVIEE